MFIVLLILYRSGCINWGQNNQLTSAFIMRRMTNSVFILILLKASNSCLLFLRVKQLLSRSFLRLPSQNTALRFLHLAYMELIHQLAIVEIIFSLREGQMSFSTQIYWFAHLIMYLRRKLLFLTVKGKHST